MPRPRDPAIDRAIVDACAALLGETGRRGLTRQAIAVRAGVTLPALTRRFPDVEAILREVARNPPAASAPTGGPSVRDHLVGVLLRSVDAMQDATLRRSAAELLAAAAGDPLIDDAFQTGLGAARADTMSRLESAVTSGELPASVDPELVIDLLFGTVYYRLLWKGRQTTPAEVGPLVDLVLTGTAPGA